MSFGEKMQRMADTKSYPKPLQQVWLVQTFNEKKDLISTKVLGSENGALELVKSLREMQGESSWEKTSWKEWLHYDGSKIHMVKLSVQK